MKTQIIYFDINYDGSIDQSAIDNISEYTNSQIDMCTNWPSMMTALTSESGSDTKLVLLGKDSLALPGTTLNEIVDAISTISALACNNSKIITAIVVTGLCEQSFVHSLKKSNINGIVPSIRVFGLSEFYEAVNTLLAESTYWPTAYIQAKIKASTRQATEYGIRLTERQREILQLICKRGLAYKKIAQVLNISESTVKVHISAILKAYGVRNRTQLALAGNNRF